MGPNPQRSINWAHVILSIILLLVASFSVQANTVEVDSDSTSSMDNFVYLPIISFGKSYYISPSGDDNRSGQSPAEAWATFDRAWADLKPGDVLTLLDGVYYQSIFPQVRGQPGKPITLRAQNDGQAIIDGQGVRIPVILEGYLVSYYVIEGIVAKNASPGSVFQINSDHNILRRVSAYNADTDTNSHVIIIAGDYNLLEDCVAAGTGRKMIVVFQGDYNVIRRCLADWREWDGRNWHDCWPWGDGIELYSSSYNIMENSIAFGHTPRTGISILSQGLPGSNGNKILGTMAIRSGMREDGTPMVWGDTRPGPTQYTCVTKFDEWPSLLSGFRMGDGGELHDNLLQDILAWGSARNGLTFNWGAQSNNNRVNRATVVNNGLDNISKWGGIGVDAWQTELDLFDSIENSYIETIWTGGSSYTSLNGEGARLTHRYVNGVLTNEPLWPWPMDDRIQAELGYSVTDLVTPIIP